MKRQNLPNPERRALNIIWTAAGDYHFLPAYTAYLPNGEPDFYMNSIIGYVRKWYDSSVMDALFEKIGHSVFRETLDGLLWVALENCTFEKEWALRPVLAEHRAEYARQFFLREQTRSRQQWMAQNSLVYAMQSARCNLILGKECGLINPWEKKLFMELQYDASMTSQEIYDRTLSIFSRYFPLRKSDILLSFILKWRKVYRNVIKKNMPNRLVRTDTLLLSRSLPGGSFSEAKKGFDINRKSPAARKNDRLYMEGCFGKALYPDDQMLAAETKLCTGPHANCHLFFSSGIYPASLPADPLIRKVREDALAQQQKNKAYYQKRYPFYQRSIQQLYEQIRNCLLVCRQPSRLRSRSGLLSSAGIWRGLYLNDPYVFTDALEEPEIDFSVDLLLDASASRLGSQETIACQGYVIARSLQLCHIPVQVSSFLSIRGYTVLRRLLDYPTRDTADPVFSYFAAGWNRDGLALRGVSYLMEASHAKNRLLVVFSDASPNDDHRMPPNRSEQKWISREYSGEPAILETAHAVHELMKNGIQVCGILSGAEKESGPKKIFGRDFARIDHMDRFSSAAGTLIQKQIEKLTMH